TKNCTPSAVDRVASSKTVRRRVIFDDSMMLLAMTKLQRYSEREQKRCQEKLLGPSKGDVLSCCRKMPSLRRTGLSRPFILPKQLRMSPSATMVDSFPTVK